MILRYACQYKSTFSNLTLISISWLRIGSGTNRLQFLGKGKCFQCSEPRNWVSGAKGGAGCVYMDIGRKNERKMQPFPFSSPSVVGQPVNHFRFRPSKEEIKCTHFISLFHEMLGTGRVSVKSLNQCVTFTFDASFNCSIQDEHIV